MRKQIIYPTPDSLDTTDWGETSGYQAALYLIPADESPSGDIEITSHTGAGNIGTPIPAYHGRWHCVAAYGPTVVGQSVLNWLESHADTWREIDALYLGSEWDGSNLKGRWDLDEYEYLPDPEDTDPLSYSIQTAWDCGDYLAVLGSWSRVCDSYSLDPARGDEVLTDLERRVEDEAAREGIYLSRTRDALEGLLQDYRDEARGA